MYIHPFHHRFIKIINLISQYSDTLLRHICTDEEEIIDPIFITLPTATIAPEK